MINKLDKIKDNGKRVTIQRTAIMEFLDGNKTHPTAMQIFEGIKKKYPSISFATVYNTMRVLKQEKIVREIVLHNSSHFDPDLSPHSHAICLNCDNVIDINIESISKIQIPQSLFEEFEPVSSEFYIYGYCKKCHQKMKKIPYRRFTQ